MIIFNFDVLARPNKAFSSRVPDQHGMHLWRDLHETHLGRIGLVIDECQDKFLLEHWLKLNGIKAAVYEILETTNPQLKAEKVHTIGMAIGRSSWYIDTDPHTITETLKLGIPSLLVANPYIMRPEWREETAARPWDELVAEIEDQKIKQAERTWGDPS